MLRINNNIHITHTEEEKKRRAYGQRWKEANYMEARSNDTRCYSAANLIDSRCRFYFPIQQ